MNTSHRYFISCKVEHEWQDAHVSPEGGFRSFKGAQRDAAYWHSQGYDTRVTDELGCVRAEYFNTPPKHA